MREARTVATFLLSGLAALYSILKSALEWNAIGEGLRQIRLVRSVSGRGDRETRRT
jgi:hypothetical protein